MFQEIPQFLDTLYSIFASAGAVRFGYFAYTLYIRAFLIALMGPLWRSQLKLGYLLAKTVQERGIE